MHTTLENFGEINQVINPGAATRNGSHGVRLQEVGASAHMASSIFFPSVVVEGRWTTVAILCRAKAYMG